MARIVLTGCAGFIGFHLATRLLDEGHEIFGVDNLNAYYDVELKQARLAQLQARSDFQFEKCDIADRRSMLEVFEKTRPQIVLHMAAQAGVRHSIDHPQEFVTANLDGFFSVLEAARSVSVGHFLYASSSSVYGSNRKIPFSESDNVDHPVSFYAATKRCNELMGHSYAHLHGLPMTGLRFFTVYGPWGRPDMALFKFTRAILKGEPIALFNDGRMSRDFTYIDDAIDAVVKLLPLVPPAGESRTAQAAPYRIVNIGSHRPVKLEDFVAAIESHLGRKALRRNEPLQPGDVPATFADVTLLKTLIGKRQETSLDEGIKAFVNWYKSYYKV